MTLRRALAPRAPIGWATFILLGYIPAMLSHVAMSVKHTEQLDIAILNIVIVIVGFYLYTLLIEDFMNATGRASEPFDKHLTFWPPTELKDPTADSIAELQRLFDIDENGNAARHAHGERE